MLNASQKRGPMNKVVIVSAARTPFGKFGGSISSVSGTELGGIAIKRAVDRAHIDPVEVDECIMGMVLPCGYGQNPAKQAAILAGLPQKVEALTINKVCGSALKAVMLGAQAIRCGDAEIVVAGGMENMSSAPYFLRGARWGQRMGTGKLEDHMLHDGLWDVINDMHMGMSNEYISEKWNVTRADQDIYAERSYARALEAISAGKFKREIVPVHFKTKGGKEIIFKEDECPVPTSFSQLQGMKPAFLEDGVGTAGNASVISDGAAAVVLMEKSRALELGCEILGEICAQASATIEMKHVLMAPVNAIPKVLEKEGLQISDIDLFEINEAFSGASHALNKVLKLDPEKVNVNGGCVALGHPIGASGGRLLATIIYEMKRREVKRGLVSLCLGGGEAVAVVVKR